MMFNQSKGLLSHVYRKEHNVDESKRFLLDQVRNNTLWFQSRTRKPRGLRDKSTHDDRETFTPPYTQHLIAPGRGEVSSLTKFMNLSWSSVYTMDQNRHRSLNGLFATNA
jgi:hypothetical protein